MPYQIKKLKVESIDSVDRGAARVPPGQYIRKRDDSDNIDVLAKAVTVRCGECDFALADLLKAFRVLQKSAQEKETNTMPININDPKELVAAITGALMKAGQSHDQAVTEILKAARKPKLQLDSPDSGDSEDDADADDTTRQRNAGDKVKKAVDALVAKGDKPDEAISKVLRAARGW